MKPSVTITKDIGLNPCVDQLLFQVKQLIFNRLKWQNLIFFLYRLLQQVPDKNRCYFSFSSNFKFISFLCKQLEEQQDADPTQPFLQNS